MKRQISCLIIALLLFSLLFAPQSMVYADTSYPAPPQIAGESAILMEAETGAVLYEHNSNEKLYPASITKIMTGLLAIENLSMEDTVQYSSNMLSVLPFDAAKLGVVNGEIMSIKNCMYALLLRSCNDVAVGLAYKISGSEEDFVKLMNERAKKAGAINSNFMNSTGLQDTNHYTTAYDMALITKAAISNPVFCEISGTSGYTLGATNVSKEQNIVNRHRLLVSTDSKYYSAAIAGKTGYTDEAGRTLVTVAKKNGITLICVILKSDDEHVYDDTRNLFEYGFNNFSKVNISDNETRFSQNSKDFFVHMSDIFVTTGVMLSIKTDDYVILPKDYSFDMLDYELDYEEDTSSGKVAKITYSCQGKKMGDGTLLITKAAENDVAIAPLLNDTQADKNKETNAIPINIWFLVGAIVIAVLLVLYIVYLIKTREKRKRNRERRKMFTESKKRFRRRKRRPIKFR